MKSKAILVTATVLSASMLGGTALARNANTVQQGTLLVFPMIDVSGTNQTVIRISNNGSVRQSVSLKCYWQNGTKEYVDFIVEVTKNQPIWFEATEGEGTYGVPPFPTSTGPYVADDAEANLKGELKCWVVRDDETSPIQYNYMSGDATVYDPSEGTAYRYNAWRFRADANNDAWAWGGATNVVPPQADGSWKLPLNGDDLSSCPQYLIGQFSPEGSQLGVGGVTVGPTELSIASCRQDFRQDRALTYTKLQFDIWNEQETKFTGAYECMNSWWSSALEDVDHAGSQFSLDALKTPTARFRVRGVASSQCDVKNPVTGAYIIKTEKAGLVGVMTESLSFGTGEPLYAKDAAELTSAGTSTADDFVWYDPEEATPPTVQ